MNRAANVPPETKLKRHLKNLAIADKWETRFFEAAKEAFEQDLAMIEALINDNQREALRRKALPNWLTLQSQVSDYFAGASAENWQSIFAPLIEGVIGEVGEEWAATLGISFDVQSVQARDWFDQYVLQFAQDISQTSGEVLHELIAQGLGTDWTTDELTAHIGQLFDQWIDGDLSPADFEWLQQRSPVWRREMIARTESIRALNFGAYELGNDWGVTEKEWLTTLDGRERESHHLADGQIRSFNLPFDVGTSKMMHPHDASLGAGPEEIIKCRCSMLLYR